MVNEITWERTGYESRVDVAADDIESFVAAVLDTIDVNAARSSPRHWEQVCRFFAGCARAAKVQGITPRDGSERIIAYLEEAFPSNGDGSNNGFFEFMDWLSAPSAFRPIALRTLLEHC